VQTDTDTLTLRVWWCNKQHWLSAVISFDLSDHVKWRKRPEMLSVWFCTKQSVASCSYFSPWA